MLNKKGKHNRTRGCPLCLVPHKELAVIEDEINARDLDKYAIGKKYGYAGMDIAYHRQYCMHIPLADRDDSPVTPEEYNSVATQVQHRHRYYSVPKTSEDLLKKIISVTWDEMQMHYGDNKAILPFLNLLTHCVPMLNALELSEEELVQLKSTNPKAFKAKIKKLIPNLDFGQTPKIPDDVS